MCRFFLILIIGSMLSGCATTAKAPRYRVTPVATVADSIACAKAGGYAMMAASLDPLTGEVNSTWGAGCAILEED